MQEHLSAISEYPCDLIPGVALEMVAQKELLPIDSQILAVLLRFRDRSQFVCWTTNAAVAVKLGCHKKTVQRSIARLESAGLVAREALDGPDPDDHRNYTGWRFVFMWLAPAGYQVGPGVVRAQSVSVG